MSLGLLTRYGIPHGSASPPAPFSPTDITGLRIWLDASDASTITDAGLGAVSKWVSKDPNSYEFTQATAGSRPTTGGTTANSLNTIEFDSDYLESADASSVWKWLHDGTTKYTVFVVAKATTSDNRLYWGTNSGSASSTIGANMRREGTSGLASRTAGFWVTSGSSSIYRALKYANANTVEDNTWHVIRLDADVGNASTAARGSFRIDGADPGDNNFEDDDISASTSNPTQTLRIGSHATNSAPFVGEIAEVLFYDRELTTQEIADTEAYLTDKWGIAL